MFVFKKRNLIRSSELTPFFTLNLKNVLIDFNWPIASDSDNLIICKKRAKYFCQLDKTSKYQWINDIKLSHYSVFYKRELLRSQA